MPTLPCAGYKVRLRKSIILKQDKNKYRLYVSKLFGKRFYVFVISVYNTYVSPNNNTTSQEFLSSNGRCLQATASVDTIPFMVFLTYIYPLYVLLTIYISILFVKFL